MQPIIELQGVGKTYGVVEAVAGTDLTIVRGELCVLIGPSGCGKTTTLKMINRVIEPSSGRILVRGSDTATLDPVELRRSIGYVIQQIGLFPHMTVEANVSIVPRLKGLAPAPRRVRAAELLELVGLPPAEYLDRYPSALSGGQQQRVGVARALAADPDIILMDEPFGSVDPLIRKQLQRELKRIHATVQKTIVLVTHDLAEAIYLADRLILMRSGRIVQSGTPRQMLFEPAEPFVARFFAEARDLGQLSLRTVGEIAIRDDAAAASIASVIPATSTLLEALLLFARSHDGSANGRPKALQVIDRAGNAVGIVTADGLLQAVARTLEPESGGKA